jgi:holin-like protein
MITAFAMLLLFQLLGEITVHLLNLPLPGPVAGMIFLFVMLMLRGSLPTTLQTTSQGLLRHLSLLFVPAGVGIMAHTALLREEWLILVITLVVSTLVTTGVTAASLCFFLRRSGHSP